MYTVIKRTIGFASIVLFTFIVSGCGGIGFAEDRTVVGKFHLFAVDSKADLSLTYMSDDGSYISVVDKTVFAVGYTDKYIVVKQHPHSNDRINKKITKYYIVPLAVKDKNSIEKSVIGPLTANELAVQMEELNIKTSYSIVYKDLQ